MPCIAENNEIVRYGRVVMRIELSEGGSEKKELKNNPKRSIHFQEGEKNESKPTVSRSYWHSVRRVL